MQWPKWNQPICWGLYSITLCGEKISCLRLYKFRAETSYPALVQFVKGRVNEIPSSTQSARPCPQGSRRSKKSGIFSVLSLRYEESSLACLLIPEPLATGFRVVVCLDMCLQGLAKTIRSSWALSWAPKRSQQAEPHTFGNRFPSQHLRTRIAAGPSTAGWWHSNQSIHLEILKARSARRREWREV